MPNKTHRGGKREGSGRRPSRTTFRRDDYLILDRQGIADASATIELARVLSATGAEIELQIGEDILVIRRPEDGELHL